MVSDNRDDGIWKTDAIDNFRADDRMHLGSFEFRRGKCTRLIKNMIRHRQLSYIVKQCACVEGRDFRLR